MEIGHNVLHGQWDWMRDPKIHSSTWEWDHVTPAAEWKRSHNESTTGSRTSSARTTTWARASCAWTRARSGSRATSRSRVNLVNACFFEYGIAAYDLELGETLRERRGVARELKPGAGEAAKAGRQIAKDYVLHPLLSGPPSCAPSRRTPRPAWCATVEPLGDHVRPLPRGGGDLRAGELDEDETRAEWYLRQMLGSANISGGTLLHILTGNLSHQIEHHLFPDLPSNRYGQIAPKVRELFERYGLRYRADRCPGRSPPPGTR